MNKKIIINALEYVYYRIYRNLKSVKTNTTPAFNALFIFMTFQLFNLLSILGVLSYVFKIQISLYRNQVVLLGLSIAILLSIPNYMYFFQKKDEIYKQYENETKEERRRGTIYVMLYIVLSVAAFFTIGETLR